MRKFAVWMHRYLGLLLGTLLLVSGLTGSLIVFKKPIDTWLNPELITVVPQAARASLDQVVNNAQQTMPANRATFVFVPESPAEALEVWFKDSDIRAYVNPYTAQVIGTRDGKASLMGFLVDLHIHLLSGETGESILGWAGLGAIPLSLLGLWLWWPKRGKWKQALQVKWQAAPLRVWLDIHKLAGVIACVFLIMTAGTGAALALYEIVTEPALIALTGEGSRKTAPRSEPVAGEKPALQPLLTQAASMFPDARLTRVILPEKPQAAIGIRLQLKGEIHQFGRTFLWFDQYSGALLRVDNALQSNQASRIQSWFYPLHTGVYGGVATRWLQVLVGLSLSLLTLSGAWLWWKGYRARATAKRRVRGTSSQPA